MAGFDDRADARAEAADRRAQRAGAARHDRAHQRAYKAGVARGRQLDRGVLRKPAPLAHDDPELQQSYEVGFREGQNALPHPIGQHVAPAVTTVREHSNEVAGFVLALIAWSLFVNYASAGTSGVKDWLKAKFFNQPANTEPAHPIGHGTPATPEAPAPPLAVLRIQPGTTQTAPGTPKANS